jgi:hypothetical protein
MFSLHADDRDGLICDETVKGMQKWVDTIGVYMRVEVRPAPALIKALLMIFDSRWKGCWILRLWLLSSVW